MKNLTAIVSIGMAVLCCGCATPRDRKASALREKHAKLGNLPKSEYVRKYGIPRQCQLNLTGELCEFYKSVDQRKSSAVPVAWDTDTAAETNYEMMWVQFDGDGYSTGRDATAGY